MTEPINMLLFCPRCDLQHVDAPHGEWTNPPHRTHRCNFCHWEWRPCDQATNGVRCIETAFDVANNSSPYRAKTQPLRYK